MSIPFESSNLHRSNRFAVRIIRNILTLFMAGTLHAGALAGTMQVYHLEDFLGKWALVTNQDATITATEAAIQRNGVEVFQRVLLLKAIASKPGPAKNLSLIHI